MLPFNARCRRRVVAIAAGLSCTVAHAAAPAPGRIMFPDSVRTVEQSAAGAKQAVISRMVLRPAESAATMSFEVSLRMRNFDEMQSRIARGELISDAEKAARYFPLAADHDRVIAWLRAQGLEVTRTDGNHLGIFGRGSVDGVAKAFRVSFARVVAVDGREFTSAVSAPSLPGDISPVVLGIHGLQPHIRRHALSTPRALRPDLQINLSGYTPAQLATAYNATGLGVTGAGQTIAIYSLAYPQSSDLTLFWSEAQVTPKLSNITNIDVAGGPVSPSDPSAEEAALDVEWVSALAPDAAIRVYGADENNPAENDEVLQQVYADIQNHVNITVFSISVGGNELDVPKDYLIIEAQYMANLASAGVTVLVASGDTGSNANGILQTTYPTSDPDVTGVGGTTLILNADNTAKNESAWSGSGGGVSVAFARPSWQKGTGVPVGNNMRVVPDVAAAADPNDGALLVYNGNSTNIGGTSWSAPTWAGFCALMNQKRGTSLGLLNPRIYPLLGTASFRDIITGNNGNYNAGVGYDLCTGLGVPDVTALLAASLTSSSAAAIPAQVGNQFATVGQSATFFVVGEGAAPISYQWQRMPAGSTSWANLADGGTYGGSATPMLVASGATTAMNGDQFQCIVANSLGTATSSPASLAVSKVGVTTLAGWPGANGIANGNGKAARFSYPGSVRTDSAGNIYVADSENYAIRKVTPSGVVTTVAGVPGTIGSTDGPVATALFNAVGGVAIDAAGNLYVADSADFTIRKVSTSGIVSTLAGLAGTKGDSDGTGSAARFLDPQNLACDAAGNLFVADGMGNVIRKVTPSGVVTTYAGNGASGSSDGAGTAAGFNDPTGIAVDGSGNVYVADSGNDTVRKILPGGVVTTLAGTPLTSGSADGTGSAARFSAPDGVSLDSSGNLYVADSKNDTIRKIDPTGFVTTITGSAGTAENIDGVTNIARLDTPGDVTVDSSGVIYVADTLNDTIRRIIPGGDAAPSFTAQPASLTVNLGGGAVFSMGLSGTAPFTFQWYLNGQPIAGATKPSFAIAQAQQPDGGAYTVKATNIDGSATSSAATLTVDLPAGYPDITVQPVGGPLASGGSLTLSVGVTGDGPFSYQWMLNGVPIPGATGPTYAASVSGAYSVAISNPVATAVSGSVLVGVGNRLINVSTRAIVQTGGAITIAGFVIHGPAGVPKQVLIRGVGPALAEFSVSGILANPTITLFGPTNTEMASNTGWGSNADPTQIAAVSAEVGAFALPAGSADSAMLAALTPGSYSVELSGVGSTTGVGLVEVYEVDTSDSSLLVNISTRAEVGTGANVLIAGFVVHGTQPATVLVRAVGPSLSAFGVTGVLAQPILTLFDSTGASFASNTGWGTNADTAQIVSVSSEVGAFALPSGSADSALVLTLAPGTYSAEVTGVGGTTGIALVEVYQATP